MIHTGKRQNATALGADPPVEAVTSRESREPTSSVPPSISALAARARLAVVTFQNGFVASKVTATMNMIVFLNRR